MPHLRVLFLNTVTARWTVSGSPPDGGPPGSGNSRRACEPLEPLLMIAKTNPNSANAEPDHARTIARMEKPVSGIAAKADEQRPLREAQDLIWIRVLHGGLAVGGPLGAKLCKFFLGVVAVCHGDLACCGKSPKEKESSPGWESSPFYAPGSSYRSAVGI